MKKSTLLGALVALGMLASLGSNAYAQGRSTYTAYTSQRGSTVNIPESRVAELCGDVDGCTIRMGMYNWDGTRRTASRESLFYYNRYTHTWRAERDDKAGTTDNNKTEHVMNAWACYFTDGYYDDWYNHGDINADFGVLSWNQYTATCRVTLID
jgi:hypothetical protein